MSLLDRETLFWEKVDKSGDCWLWTGAPNSNGYGSFWNGSAPVGAHTMAWVYTGGDLEDGLELDHLCEVTLCVNPDHLELVTHSENIKRHYQRNPRTNCIRGHSLDDAYVRKNGTRRCKRCANDASVASRQKKRLGL